MKSHNSPDIILYIYIYVLQLNTLLDYCVEGLLYLGVNLLTKLISKLWEVRATKTLKESITQWKGKLFFLPTVLKIAYVLDPKLEPLLEPKDDVSEAVRASRKAWRGHGDTSWSYSQHSLRQTQWYLQLDWISCEDLERTQVQIWKISYRQIS